MDIAIWLDTSSKCPIHEQLLQALRKAIAAGQIRPGESLPSSRDLANLLGISRSTIVKTYRRLIGEGLAEARTGSATFVRGSVDDNVVDGAAPSPFRPRSQRMERMLRAVEFPEVTSLPAAPSGQMSFIFQDGPTEDESTKFDCSPIGRSLPLRWIGAPPVELLPTREWSKIWQKQCRLLEEEMDDFDESDSILSEVVGAYLRRAKGVNCQANQVFVLPGKQSALHLISGLLINSGDLVALENPCHASVGAAFEAEGAQLCFVDVDANGMNVEQLEKLGRTPKVVYVSPAHHFPSGATMSFERRRTLIEWAKRVDAWIVEDACDSDFYYSQSRLPAIQGLDEGNRVFFLYSFAAAMNPIANHAMLIAPARSVQDVVKVKRSAFDQCSSVETRALTEFVQQGRFERHLSQSRSAYRTRRQALLFYLSQRFRETMNTPHYSAGLHQLVKFNFPLSVEDIMDAARSSNLPFVHCASLCAGTVDEHEFLIPFGGIVPTQVDESVQRFADEIRRRLRERAFATQVALTPTPARIIPTGTPAQAHIAPASFPSSSAWRAAL